MQTVKNNWRLLQKSLFAWQMFSKADVCIKNLSISDTTKMPNSEVTDAKVKILITLKVSIVILLFAR